MMILPKITFAITLLIASGFSLASITESECGNYDYSDRFPPTRDQNGVGYCWAFASTAIVEEELCLESKQPDYTGNYKCGEKLSVLDMSRCNFRMGTAYGDGEGGNEESALNCILKAKASYKKIVPKEDGKSAEITYVEKTHTPGLCPENLAPFDNLRKGLNGFIDRNLRGIVSPSSFNDLLIKQKEECNKLQSASGPSSNTEELINQHVEILKKLLPNQAALGVDFKAALKKGEINEDFLRDILISPQCSEMRINPNRKLTIKNVAFKGEESFISQWSNGKSKSWTEKKPDKPINERATILSDIFKSGKSVSAGICSSQYLGDVQIKSKLQRSMYQFEINPKECGGHGVVYNGMRWNKEKNICEIQVRNSWGKGSYLSGWVEADRLLKHTFDITYLEAGKP